jgi:hypothetical protein
MSCPFYGAALMDVDRGMGRHGPPVLMASRGNECALITSAHSPCWMEVSESRAPAWAECPRNPEFVATQISRAGEGPDRKEMKRLEDAAVSLSYLRELRSRKADA